jgi:hypothetical protein
VGPFFSCFNRYVISAPKVFRVGASERVVIQVYGYTEAFDATISIKSYPDKKFSYSSGSVNLRPENKFQNSAVLTVCISLSFSLHTQNILIKYAQSLNIDNIGIYSFASAYPVGFLDDNQ